MSYLCGRKNAMDMEKQDIYDCLKALGVPYEVTEHGPVYDMRDLARVNLPHPDALAKNLFVRDDKRQHYYLITVRAGKQVDLKAFRRAHGTRPLSLADAPELHSMLGLKPGSVGPFGLLNGSAALCVPLFLDEDFMEPPALIGIHPNDNTATVGLRTADLAGLLRRYGCEVHAVSF